MRGRAAPADARGFRGGGQEHRGRFQTGPQRNTETRSAVAEGSLACLQLKRAMPEIRWRGKPFSRPFRFLIEKRSPFCRDAPCLAGQVFDFAEGGRPTGCPPSPRIHSKVLMGAPASGPHVRHLSLLEFVQQRRSGLGPVVRDGWQGAGALLEAAGSGGREQASWGKGLQAPTDSVEHLDQLLRTELPGGWDRSLPPHTTLKNDGRARS